MVLIIIIFLIILFVFLRKKQISKAKKKDTKRRAIRDFDSSVFEMDLKPPSKPFPDQFSATNQIYTSTISKPGTELSFMAKDLPKPSQTPTLKPPILDYQSKMVGRDYEMNELKGYLEEAEGGNGSTILISGETGIGKTRLINEIIQIAEAKGFQVLSSNCLYESLTPFMPIVEALKSGGLDYLFAKEAPRVEAVYLVSNSGLLIKEVIRQKTTLNPDIFASMLTNVSNFVKESLSMLSGKEMEGTLNTLGFENYRILIESGKNINLVVLLTGKENEFLINDMRDIYLEVDQDYGEEYLSG